MTSDKHLRIPPAAMTLGAAERSADPDSGTSLLTFDAPPTLENTMGDVQGGFVAAMLDSSMGLALRSVLPEGSTAPTLEMKVSYFQPAPIGRLVGRGRVVRRGKTIAFLEAELSAEVGAVLARATSTVRVVPPR